jgi:hypothetical protein
MGAFLAQALDAMGPLHWAILAFICAVGILRVVVEELLKPRPGKGVARLARHPAHRGSLPRRITRPRRARVRTFDHLARRAARHPVPMERTPQQN